LQTLAFHLCILFDTFVSFVIQVATKYDHFSIFPLLVFASAMSFSYPPSDDDNNQHNLDTTSSVFDTGNDPFSTSEESESPTLDFGHLDRINPLTIAPALGVYAPGYGNSPEYLFAEDYTDYRKKSWGEQLMYWTGVSYLTGAVTGGSYGLVEGLGSSGGKSWKLRVNAILNASGRRGAALANACGILALMFSGFESLYDHYLGEDTVYNYALAGISAGLVYKSTAGLKPASIYSAGLGLAGVIGIYAARQGIYGRRLQKLI